AAYCCAALRPATPPGGGRRHGCRHSHPGAGERHPDGRDRARSTVGGHAGQRTDPMIIDSHMHVWDRSVSTYEWITEDLEVLNELHTPSRNADALARCGIDQVVLVQAEDSGADTEYMIDTAY